MTLGDKIPVDIKALSLGGNGGNTAAALKKLDITTSFYTSLGDDVLSSHIKNTLENEGIKLIVEKEITTTGSLSLILNFDTDRIILSHHNISDHSFDSSKITETPDVIFLSSIGKTWEDAYEKTLEYAHTSNIPIAFSPGSLQLQNINETFIKTVHQSKMLFCNMEEARIINEKLSGQKIEDIKELLLNLKNYGFELLSITDGANGAYAVDKENRVYKISSLKADGSEKTGAGDAYAGAFLASYLQEKEISECMKRGVLNSLGVMAGIGAHTGQLRTSQMQHKENEVDLDADII
jgi:sugar/nucleoside kinase (ribokinase family)